MAYTYASEADILNMALFGKTAAQWRNEKGIKGKTPNIRDFASAEELVVLINLEDTNADLIRQEVPKIERLKILREKAYRQLELLRKNQDTIAALKKIMCKQLLSPIESIEYLKWREVFYKNNGPINLLITETNNGFVLSKPQKNENLVQQYLYEKYGENAIYEDRLYYELFRQYVLVLYEHKEIESEINGCYEIIKFLAHLFRDEIKCFVERTEKALLIAKTKKFIPYYR